MTKLMRRALVHKNEEQQERLTRPEFEVILSFSGMDTGSRSYQNQKRMMKDGCRKDGSRMETGNETGYIQSDDTR
jgi:hypothetical protein